MQTRRFTEYKAQMNESWDFRYKCASCGYGSKALAIAEGVGFARHEGHADSLATAELARDAAAEGSMKNARLLVSLAPCPRCGKRSASALAGHVVKCIVIALVFGSVGAGCSWASVAPDGSLRWLLLVGALAVFALTAFNLWVMLLPIRESKQAVRFEEPPDGA